MTTGQAMSAARSSSCKPGPTSVKSHKIHPPRKVKTSHEPRAPSQIGICVVQHRSPAAGGQWPGMTAHRPQFGHLRTSPSDWSSACERAISAAVNVSSFMSNFLISSIHVTNIVHNTQTAWIRIRRRVTRRLIRIQAV